ncbi:LysM peptidoglycan-binding domain-containing protein, partial [bacterium]|nr:LysM peptidoglycan-binding domain-containing protein [bacterium]
LKRLYNEMDDWYLSMAAYNYSKRKLVRAMKRYKTRDYWKLKTIPRETRNHIPKIIAAAIISKNPSAYGFKNIKYMSPVEFEEVHIDKCIDLAVASKCAKVDYLKLKDLNPELRTWFTPPYPGGYTLKIPKGRKKIFKKNYAAVPDNLKVSKVVHRVRRGETLSIIARRYHTTIHNIKSVNSLRSIHRLSIGQKLVIPAPPQSEIAYRTKTQKTRRTSYSPVPQNKEDYEKVIYKIRKGDTLSEIAENYKTSSTRLRRWNNLTYKRFIHPGQELTIWVKKGLKPSNGILNFGTDVTYAMEPGKAKNSGGRTYFVKRGDTLWKIAMDHGIKLNTLLRQNKKSKRSIIKPGERIIIPAVD